MIAAPTIQDVTQLFLEVIHQSIDKNPNGSGRDQQNGDSQVSFVAIETDDGAAFFLGGELNGIGDQIFQHLDSSRSVLQALQRGRDAAASGDEGFAIFLVDRHNGGGA